MKLSLASASAFIGAVSAYLVEQRAISQEFDVTEFSAGCIPHGTLCTFSFNVATNEMPTPTNCNASISTAYTLPDVPSTDCVDPSISWSFSAVDSGDNYTLTLADSQGGLTAAKIWDEADFPIIDAGSTVYQQYIGPTSFVVQ